MQRAIKEIMDKVTDECVITSCGYISREVYEIRDRPRNFYVLGAMGSALGIGQADVTTRRLVDKIDFEATAINCLTSCGPEDAKIPLAFKSDREALAAVLMTLRPYSMDDLRIVHIKNTLELTHLLVSQGCAPQLKANPNLHFESNTY